ncbi:orphan protein [Vibrio sp. JCM 19236]|nr:orphan protein [Vibrio sp. JCM 19236]
MLIDTLINKDVSFEAVSDFWYMTGKHRDFGLSKRQRAELQRLGPIDVLDERTFAVSFACNQFNAEAFKVLFRSRLFQCFEVSFLLEQNRKQSPERKLELIKTHYAKKGERITVNTIATGASRFTVTFRFIPDSPLLFQTLIDYLK